MTWLERILATACPGNDADIGEPCYWQGANLDVRLFCASRVQAAEGARLRPADEWHDGHGDVMWWRLPVEEPPYVGSPLEEDFPEDYYTHWEPVDAPEGPGSDACPGRRP